MWVIPLRTLFHDLFEAFLDPIAEIQQFGEWRSGSWSWNWAWAAYASGLEAEQLEEFKSTLMDVSLINDRKDRWCWAEDSNTCFSVKTCYKWLVGCRFSE